MCLLRYLGRIKIECRIDEARDIFNLCENRGKCKINSSFSVYVNWRSCFFVFSMWKCTKK